MGRKRKKKKKPPVSSEWKRRVQKMVDRGWIQNPNEIPDDAFPIDIDKINTSSAYPQLYYRDKEFNCVDCGKPQVFKVKDQVWYYEEIGGLLESQAIRCRECRKPVREEKEKQRELMRQHLAKKEREIDPKAG